MKKPALFLVGDAESRNMPGPADRRDYAEASYFDGYHFQHIADFYEHGRLAQIERKWRAFWGGRR